MLQGSYNIVGHAILLNHSQNLGLYTSLPITKAP